MALSHAATRECDRRSHSRDQAPHAGAGPTAATADARRARRDGSGDELATASAKPGIAGGEQGFGVDGTGHLEKVVRSRALVMGQEPFQLGTQFRILRADLIHELCALGWGALLRLIKQLAQALRRSK